MIIILIGALLLGYSFLDPQRTKPVFTRPQSGNRDGMEEAPAESSPPSVSDKEKPFISPISRAAERVTKKPFGIYVSPSASPVSPERFTGYHTAVDFEILSGEEDADVSVFAICDGEIVYKGNVDGYGGLVIQRCAWENQPVTVLYGHVRLSGIPKGVGENLTAGEQVGFLGEGYTPETDQERKHLHLGIHKGSALEFRGYISEEARLGEWLDVRQYITS